MKKTRTETVVERMIIYTLGTGSITALCAVIALITELAKPETFAYVLLDLLIPNGEQNFCVESDCSSDSSFTQCISIQCLLRKPH